MRTTRQQKAKVGEAPKIRNELTCGGGVKKSENRTGGRRQKATGGNNCILGKEDSDVLYFSAAQALVQPLPNKEKFLPETTQIPSLELKTGQLHPSAKIKLQLFPIDESTCRGLEKDGYNPFLELTLSARKKISSVFNHLDTKWGSSSVAVGELILFPYNVKSENLANSNRWTSNDNGITAGDVYRAIESPVLFRLRYGWFFDLKPKTSGASSTSTPLACLESEGNQKGCSTVSGITYDQRLRLKLTDDEFKMPFEKSKTADAVVSKHMLFDASVDYVDDEVKIDNGPAQSIVPWDDSLTNLSIGGLLSEASLQGRTNNCDPKSKGSISSLQPIQLISDVSVGGLLFEASLQAKINEYDLTSNGGKLELQPIMDKDLAQSVVPWDDSITTLSIGGLLSEASLQARIHNCDPKANGSMSGMQPTLSISDSFDACIAAQNSHSLVSKPLSHESHSSILDAEETCHAFSFKKCSPGKDIVDLSGGINFGGCGDDASLKPYRILNFAELKNQAGFAQHPRQESKTDSRGVYNEDNSLGLTGIKWNDSLGPFDLGLSTSRQITSGDNRTISEFVR